MTDKLRVLISVSDKTNLIELADFFKKIDADIVATGKTGEFIEEAGVKITTVETITGFPEILDGRVKTLNPLIFGGILSDRTKQNHIYDLTKHNITPFDVVIVNLYPFAETVLKGLRVDDCIENIDIGGVSLLRAAAKNYKNITVISTIDDYLPLIEEIKLNHKPSLSFNQKMAAKAFALTASYEAEIANWFQLSLKHEEMPEHLFLSLEKQNNLRYGENPHQKAAFYIGNKRRYGIADTKILHGKELGFNNIADACAAFDLVCEFDKPAAAVIKHSNPCGAAIGQNIYDAYLKALACDRLSAFGGIAAFNCGVDKKTAEEILNIFTEVVIAPDFLPEALDVLKTKKNLRLIATEKTWRHENKELEIKGFSGGYLVQEADNLAIKSEEFNVVTNKKPTQTEIENLLFAMKTAKHVRSNAVVLVRNLMTVGIGAGQMSRVDSTKIAGQKASTVLNADLKQEGLLLASDAFFPFADSIEEAAKIGVTAIIQPGGSIRDDEVIVKANELNLAMVFTGTRHFRH